MTGTACAPQVTNVDEAKFMAAARIIDECTEFGDIANLEQGSSVRGIGKNGDSCDYEVVDSFVVPRGTLWSEVSDRVIGHGESIVMQTCVEDGYLIVVAE